MAPFLTCNSYPMWSDQPTHFAVVVDAKPSVDVPVLKNPDGTVMLHYDIGSVTAGTHNVNVKAVIIDPTFGRLESSAAPFQFQKPSNPATPGNIALSLT